jgi:hypothetical protein
LTPKSAHPTVSASIDDVAYSCSTFFDILRTP